jgi:hypothetical protein
MQATFRPGEVPNSAFHLLANHAEFAELHYHFTNCTDHAVAGLMRRDGEVNYINKHNHLHPHTTVTINSDASNGNCAHVLKKAIVQKKTAAGDLQAVTVTVGEAVRGEVNVKQNSIHITVHPLKSTQDFWIPVLARARWICRDTITIAKMDFHKNWDPRYNAKMAKSPDFWSATHRPCSAQPPETSHARLKR